MIKFPVTDGLVALPITAGTESCHALEPTNTQAPELFKNQTGLLAFAGTTA